VVSYCLLPGIISTLMGWEHKLDLLIKKSIEAADRVYKIIEKKEIKANRTIGQLSSSFNSLAANLGKEKIAFLANEVGDLVGQIKKLRNHKMYTEILHKEFDPYLTTEEQNKFDEYSGIALKLETAISGPLSDTAVAAISASAGVTGVATQGTVMVSPSPDTTLEPGMEMKENLPNISEINHNITPVAIVGSFLKRNQNNRLLERAEKDLVSANDKVAVIYSNCEILSKTSQKIELYCKNFSHFRESAKQICKKVENSSLKYEKYYNSRDLKKTESAKVNFTCDIKYLKNFLINSKTLLELDVLQIKKDKIPIINHLFDDCITKMKRLSQEIESYCHTKEDSFEGSSHNTHKKENVEIQSQNIDCPDCGQIILFCIKCGGKITG
jgi:hypothetical protein